MTQGLQFSRTKKEKAKIREIQDFQTQPPEFFLNHIGCTLYLNHAPLRYMQDNLG